MKSEDEIPDPTNIMGSSHIRNLCDNILCVWRNRERERLDTDIRNMPSRYVRRDDYRDDMGEIKVLLGKISDKLDHKVDKP